MAGVPPTPARMATEPAGPTRAAWSTPRFASLVLALLLGLQPITTDLVLPALPALAADLRAPMASVQLTMSALILSFGIAQLFWGPVADRFGRRPVLLAGLALYTLAGVGAALAADVVQVVAWRALQGAALSAAVVCARAMVRDLFEPQQGAVVMSRAMSLLGVLAIASPALGGVLVAAWGWRAPVAAMAAVGAFSVAFVAVRLPETAPRRNPDATRPRPLWAQSRAMLRHAGFRAWVALLSSSYATLFVFLAGAGFVLIGVLGLAPERAGLVMATGSMGYIVGTFVCRRWLPRVGLTGTVALGARFHVATVLLMLLLAATDWRSVWALMLPVWLFAIGHGVLQPCGQVGAVAPFPAAAGLASALAGCALAVAAFGAGTLIGLSFDGTLRPLALCMAAGAALTAWVSLRLVQRHGGTSTGSASGAET